MTDRNLIPSSLPPDPVQTRIEQKANIKQLQQCEGFKLHPGQKLYEMVVVSLTGEPVAGLSKDPETGEDLFDPELALVREVIIDASTAVFGQAAIAIAEIRGVGYGGPIQPGVRRRVIKTPGNFYQPAINAETARRKIINKYFKP